MIKFDVHKTSVKRRVSIQLFWSCTVQIKVTEHAIVRGSNWRYPECQLTSRQNYEKIVHVFYFNGNKPPYPGRNGCLQQSLGQKSNSACYIMAAEKEVYGMRTL